jgi:two-component sensor histidine kinase
MTTMAMDSATGAKITVLPPAPEFSSAEEINHRVANSLQLLSALVMVEARGVVDPLALAALDMTRQRIAAIASVHRQLYRSGDAAMVDLGAYLEDLGADLEAGGGNTAMGRRVIVGATSVIVPAEEATAIGIIVSELVSNAYKYAYEPSAPGSVRIVLRSMGFGGYKLEVEDRGRGRGLAGPVKGTGLGGRLIEMMAARIGGHYDYQDARPGTLFTLRVGKR